MGTTHSVGRWASAFAVMVSAMGATGATPILQRVVSGVEFPTSVAFAPGDATRLFILEQYTGKIRVAVGGRLQEDPFLDLGDRVADSGVELGLCGLAFHPRYQENGLFFVNFADRSGNSVIERYAVTANPNIADPASAAPVMTIEQPQPEHNVGTLLFGPEDGFLYIGSGDGGVDTFTETHSANAQDLTSPLGKILRVDVDGDAPYAIPESNPFAGHPSNDPRIWVYGLRNPWRFAFDQATGDMYIGDVGFLFREEINVIAPGNGAALDFGWPAAEGKGCFAGFPGACHIQNGRIPPIYDYSHTVDAKGSIPSARAIVGGYVYRGANMPDLQGVYFFADYPTGEIWSLRYVGGAVSELTDWTDTLTPLVDAEIEEISSLGEDEAGEIYICSYKDGSIYKIVTLAQVADLNRDGKANAVDIQLVLNGALGLPTGAARTDVNEDGATDATDVQLVVNGVLGK